MSRASTTSGFQAVALGLLMTVGIATATAAEPVITGISGIPGTGRSITVSGSGFGVKSPVTPLKFDNFDDGSSGAYLQQRDPRWQSYRGGKGLAYSDLAPHSGSLALRQRNGDGECFTSNFFTCTPASDELFASYWFRVDVNRVGRTVIKMTRLTSSKAAGGGGVYNGAGATTLGGSYDLSSNGGPYLAFTAKADGSDETPGTGDWGSNHFAAPPRSTWVKVDCYKKLSTPGVADGVVEYRLHLDAKANNAAITRAAGAAFQMDTVLLGTMEGAALAHDYDVSIDDVYIDNTRARVEICDTATWATRTHGEIQIPHTQWNDGQLQVTINQGSFAAGSTQYLYVVNRDGVANANGFPIVLAAQVEAK